MCLRASCNFYNGLGKFIGFRWVCDQQAQAEGSACIMWAWYCVGNATAFGSSRLQIRYGQQISGTDYRSQLIYGYGKGYATEVSHERLVFFR